MKLVLLSDEKVIFDGEASSVSCVSPDGPFVIMDDHIPYISRIMGSISYTTQDNSTNQINIENGFIYTNGNTCFAVIDTR